MCVWGHTHDGELTSGSADKFTRASSPSARSGHTGRIHGSSREQNTSLSVGRAEPRPSVSVPVRPGDLGPNANKQAEPPGRAQTVPLSLEEPEHPELIHEDQDVEGTTAQRSSCGNRFSSFRGNKTSTCPQIKPDLSQKTEPWCLWEQQGWGIYISKSSNLVTKKLFFPAREKRTNSYVLPSLGVMFWPLGGDNSAKTILTFETSGQP